MGPAEDSTRPVESQGRRRRCTRRPRTRSCLLKGCEQRFHPQQARQRYCSQKCREAARQWSRWKAQQSYRATAAGKEKRNGQCRRYRERVRNRQQAPPDAVPESARVITTDFFSIVAATGPDAMQDSITSHGRRCSASVPTRAGAPWNASGGGSGAGGCVYCGGEKGAGTEPQIRRTY